MLLAERSAKGQTPFPALTEFFSPQKYYVFLRRRTS